MQYTRNPVKGFPSSLCGLSSKKRVKGHVRGIYALKRIVHMSKAHGMQKPR